MSDSHPPPLPHPEGRRAMLGVHKERIHRYISKWGAAPFVFTPPSLIPICRLGVNRQVLICFFSDSPITFPILILFYLPADLLDAEEEEEILDAERGGGEGSVPFLYTPRHWGTLALSLGNDPWPLEVAIWWVKRMGFGVRYTWVWISVLPLSGWLDLGKFLLLPKSISSWTK